MTEQEAALKVWESYFKELLNQERNSNDLELPDSRLCRGESGVN